MKGHSHEEFEEIGCCGGKIELLRDEKGIAMQVSGSGPGPMKWLQMGVALDCSRMAYWPIRGVDMRDPVEPAPMVSTLLPADQTGLWGRECPKCKSYFRTDGMAELMICVYCDHEAPMAAFTTGNQKRFLQTQIELWNSAIDGVHNTVIDLDKIAKELPSNRPAWEPKEERQQFRFRCEGCKRISDVLGEYAACPNCGRRNSLIVFQGHMTKLNEEFALAESSMTARTKREAKWAALLPRYVSTFEAMAEDIRSQLQKFPTTPRRRKAISSLSFQHITAAANLLKEWFAIEIFEGIAGGDQDFLKLVFNRRHLLVHRAGRVDVEYLQNTADTTVRLHQQLRIRSREVRRLADLLSRCGENLFNSYLSIE